jgi:hypothetical protein
MTGVYQLICVNLRDWILSFVLMSEKFADETNQASRTCCIILDKHQWWPEHVHQARLQTVHMFGTSIDLKEVDHLFSERPIVHGFRSRENPLTFVMVVQMMESYSDNLWSLIW